MLCLPSTPASPYACIMHSHAQKPDPVQNQLKHVIGCMQSVSSLLVFNLNNISDNFQPDRFSWKRITTSRNKIKAQNIWFQRLLFNHDKLLSAMFQQKPVTRERNLCKYNNNNNSNHNNKPLFVLFQEKTRSFGSKQTEIEMTNLNHRRPREMRKPQNRLCRVDHGLFYSVVSAITAEMRNVTCR